MVFFRTLRSGFRHLLSQKLNSALHIAGLSLGMTVCLLIGLFIRFESSFDNYHPNAERIYRINQVWTDAGNPHPHYSTPLPLAEALRQNASGLEKVTFIHPTWGNIIDVEPGQRFQQFNVMIADQTFLDVFTVELVNGKGHETLRTPYQALLTESTAKKFFGTEDPIGKTFRFKTRYEITVGGVIKDPPANTHLPATVILSYVPEQEYLGSDPNSWTSTAGTMTYVVVPENYEMTSLQAQLDRLADQNINSNPNIPKLLKGGFSPMPLLDTHFDAATHGSHWVPAVNVTWLWFFGTIGLSVLALACINFVNLSTAQALSRAKEVGVRKSIGAGRANLLLQFIGEAWMLATFAGIVAVGAAEFSLPYMNTMLETGIRFDLLSSPALMASLVGGIFLVGLLAGVYPAWIITRFNPAISLRSGFNIPGEHGASWLRRSLVILQFTISAGLLISLVLISEQVEYIQSKNLGFNRDNMIVARVGTQGESTAFAHELEKISAVEGWSFCTAAPSSEEHWGTMMSTGGHEDPRRQNVTLVLGDENYCKLYGFKLIAGRFPIASDTNLIANSVPNEKKVMKAVVNEKLLDELKLGSPEEALGKHFWFGVGNGDIEVAGVVANFNTQSLHEPIRPTIIGQMPEAYNVTSIKIREGSDMPAALAAVETAWKSAYPEGVFFYNFLDEQIDNFYKSETRIYTLFKVFSGLAMLISLLGLWGLITFTAQRRMKEISIRKVLGATVSSLMILLSRDFFYMVMIALLIACPLVYYGISEWLTAFAFKISIGWQAFTLAGIITIALALITVGIQALRATFTNPASTLKSE